MNIMIVVVVVVVVVIVIVSGIIIRAPWRYS